MLEAGLGDLGGGATSSREIPDGDGTTLELGEAMKGVRQKTQVSLPPPLPTFCSARECRSTQQEHQSRT